MTPKPEDYKLLPVSRDLKSDRCGELRNTRIGCMLHFDDSSEDDWAVEWFTEAACQVSYNRLYLDDGSVVQIAGQDKRAWHAGVGAWHGRTDGNSAFYGLAAATNAKVPVTQAQYNSIVHDCVALFLQHGWSSADASWRIAGHDEVALPPGRKIDPTGYSKTKPILSTNKVRQDVAKILQSMGK